MSGPIRFLKPTFPDPDALQRVYAEIVNSGIYANGGPKERAFTAALADWIGGEPENVAVVTSGTAAIALAVAGLFDSDRRYVLVPSFTHPAGPLMIKAAGYEPVFVDICPSWHPALECAAEFLRRDGALTAGIVLTNSFGVGNPEIGEWERLAQRYGVALLVDSAAGLGSLYADARPLGLRGSCEAFSFHATKTLAIGEGGAVISRDRRLIADVQRLKRHGYDDQKVCVALGTNAKPPELSSAIGVLQMERLQGRIARRREIQREYERLLSPLGISFQPLADLSAVAFVSALLPAPTARDAAVRALDRERIRHGTYYQPLHSQPAFRGCAVATELAATDDIASRILSLPTYDDLTCAEIEQVACVLAAAI